jgi:enediyne biosynthesis protein E3
MPKRALARLLHIPPRAASFAELGFAPAPAGERAALEKVLAVFLDGYNRTLASADLAALAADLAGSFDAHHVGFAFEGAGFALSLKDLLTPWRPSRLAAFLAGPGRDHDYIATVGAGFAFARLPWGRWLWPRYYASLDPLIAWCMADGFGFHEGVFARRRYIAGRAAPPSWLPDFARVLFDSGLGRSLWWSEGASPQRIARVLATFPAERRHEMWCGIGVAAAYAGGTGGVGEEALAELRDLAGPYRADFLSGVPFATRMRQKGNNPSPVTERACRLLLGRSAEAASDWLVDTVERAMADEAVPEDVRRRDGYLLVRRRLVDELKDSGEGEPQCRDRAESQELTTASF